MPLRPTLLIRLAINRQRVIKFRYAGLLRICEPHVLGITNGRRQILCWQLEGGSETGNLPEWRRFDVGKMQILRITSQNFPGSRLVPHPHSKWDQILLTV